MLLTSLVLASAVTAPAPLHHTIRVTLDPSTHRLAVDAVLTWAAGTREPSLHDLRRKFPDVAIERPDAHTIKVRYAGTIRDALEHPDEEYGRGFATTSGT